MLSRDAGRDGAKLQRPFAQTTARSQLSGPFAPADKTSPTHSPNSGKIRRQTCALQGFEHSLRPAHVFAPEWFPTGLESSRVRLKECVPAQGRSDVAPRLRSKPS